MLTEIQKQVARMRDALNRANDETGSMRTREADVAFNDAWAALTGLEHETGTPAAVAAAEAAA